MYATVQWLFKLCRENGYVYKGHYTGQYCIFDNAFVRCEAWGKLSGLRAAHGDGDRGQFLFQAFRVSEAAS